MGARLSASTLQALACCRALHWLLPLKAKMADRSLQGKRIVLTGGTSGLGLGLLHECVRLGAAKVFLVCRSQTRGEAARVFQASVGGGAAGRIPLRVAQENFVARTDVRLQQFRVFLFERVRISKAETHSVQRCDAHGKSENGGYFQQRALYCAQRREERIFHEFYFPGKSVQVSRTAVENE